MHIEQTGPENKNNHRFLRQKGGTDMLSLKDFHVEYRVTTHPVVKIEINYS